MNSPTNKRLIFTIAIFVILLWSLYSIVSAIVINNSTGQLKVTSKDKTASITVTQTNKQAAFIGVGSANVHLKEGTYIIGVSDKGQLATKVVNVQKKQTTNVALDPDQTIAFPSISAVKFEGVSSLVANGITTQQATELELDFFNFQPRSQSVIIDSSSIDIPPRDPATAIGFTINFNVNVGGNTYSASASYTDITNIRLVLHDSAGAVVYDSYNQ